MDEQVELFNELLYQFIEESKAMLDTEDTEARLVELLQLMYAMYYSELLIQISDDLGVSVDEDDTSDIDNYVTIFRNTLADLKSRVVLNFDIENETLAESVEKDKWQAIRITNSDIWIIAMLASVALMKSYQRQHEESVSKRWVSSMDDKTCEICRALHGTTVAVDEPFVANGQVVTLGNGEEYTHNWINSDVANVHPHDRCKIVYIISIDGAEQTVDFNLSAHNI